MWIWKLLWSIIFDQRGQDVGQGEPPADAGQGEPPAAGIEGEGEPAGQGGEPPAPPKFGEFGDDPNEAAVKLFEAYQITKGDFDNFKTKSGLTERNLGALRKTLEASGIRAVEGEDGQIRLEVAKPADKKLRFTQDHLNKLAFHFQNDANSAKGFLDLIRPAFEDWAEELLEGRDRTLQTQKQKMQQFMSEKAEVEELMLSYFPQLDGNFDRDGKSQNAQFNQAFFDRATEIWETDYNKNPLKQLSAALRAAKELNIIPQMIEAAKKEGVRIGKDGKKILAPVSGGGAAGGAGMRKLSQEEYFALVPEKRVEYDKWRVEHPDAK